MNILVTLELDKAHPVAADAALASMCADCGLKAAAIRLSGAARQLFKSIKSNFER